MKLIEKSCHTLGATAPFVLWEIYNLYFVGWKSNIRFDILFTKYVTIEGVVRFNYSIFIKGEVYDV